MSIFPKNIRSTASDESLKNSLAALGWKREFPAIQDQDGNIIVGHRRLRFAKQLEIEPVIKTVNCKDDKEREEIAVASNVGFDPMAKEDRIRIARRMYGDGTNLTQEQIAAVLNVSQNTISRDLAGLTTSAINQKRAKTKRNPKGRGGRKGSTPPVAAIGGRRKTPRG